LARFESEIKEKSTLAVNSGDEEATAKSEKLLNYSVAKKKNLTIQIFFSPDRKKSVEKVEKKKKGNKSNHNTTNDLSVKGKLFILRADFFYHIHDFFTLNYITEETQGRKKSSKKNTATASSSPENLGHSDVLDMPVDPNEPTYCLCHQVSYGEMIGCDNPDVNHCFISSSSDHNTKFSIFLF